MVQGNLKVILASGSRNRQSILSSLGVRFMTAPSGVDERRVRGRNPVDRARKIAQAKARDVAAKREGIIIAADTFGALGRKELQKPNDRAEARKMLRLMSGRKIRMVTGICIINTKEGKETTASRVAYLKCKDLSDGEIERYVTTRPVTEWAAANNPQDTASSAIFTPCGDYPYGMDRFSLPVDVVARALGRAGMKVDLSKLRPLARCT